jgi:AcrR family transcriptional regulator
VAGPWSGPTGAAERTWAPRSHLFSLAGPAEPALAARFRRVGTIDSAGMKRAPLILEAAEKLFYERSFDGVGVDEIGKAAGISGPTVYRHFSSKEEILAALFSDMFDALLIKLGQPDADPRRDLERLVGSFIEFALDHERIAAIWMREQQVLSDRYRREHTRQRRLLNRRWTECVGRCYPDVPRGEILTCVRALQAILMSEATRAPGSRKGGNARKVLTDMALAGVTALERREVLKTG